MILCENCGRRVYGLWKYTRFNSGRVYCSKKCLRILIQKLVIPRLEEKKEYPELGIVAERT